MAALTEEQRQDFAKAAAPLIKWMKGNLHPHHTAIVDCGSAELLEAKCSCGEVFEYLNELEQAKRKIDDGDGKQ